MNRNKTKKTMKPIAAYKLTRVTSPRFVIKDFILTIKLL